MELQDWKDKLGAAFNIEVSETETTEETKHEEKTLEQWQGKQMVNVMLDKRNRNGKKVTLITDLLCDEESLKNLAKELKTICGVGGSARGGEILIQGDVRDKVLNVLKSKGLKARII